MKVRKIIPRLIFQTMLAIALGLAHTGGADAQDQREMAAPCNLSPSLAPPHSWIKNSKVTVVLESLTRTPAMMTRLTWAYCNSSATLVEIDGWVDLGAANQGAQIVRLVDQVSGNTHSPVLLEAFAFGSFIPSRVELAPGEAFVIWMNFPNVPVTVNHVDVEIDAAGVFKAVPIE